MADDAPSMSVTQPEHGAAAVHFPYDLASTAIAELQRVGRALDEKVGARADLALGARADWTGPHANEFVSVFSAQQTRAGEVAEACRTAASTIETAWGNANAEQARLNRLAEERTTVSRQHAPI